VGGSNIFKRVEAKEVGFVVEVPAPSSIIIIRDMNDQSVQFVTHLDLAG